MAQFYLYRYGHEKEKQQKTHVEKSNLYSNL